MSSSTCVATRREPPGRRAAKDAAPFAVALIPFGMAIGVASADAGMSAFEAVFGVALLAGAAQLAAVEVIGSGGGVLTAAIVVALINLRFAFYGAGLARWFAEAGLRRRLVLVIPLVDQNFMLCQERFASIADVAWRQRYYLAATAVLTSAFIVSQVAAFHLGGALPEWLGLHLAAPLAFAGMLAKTVATPQHVVAGGIAAGVVVVGTGLAGAAALPIGVAAGVGAALTVGRGRT